MEMTTNRFKIKQQEKRERFATIAANKRKQAQSRSDAGWNALQTIPFGQPILVGHHSEKSDRSYRARAIRNIDKSIELNNTAKHYEDKAEGYGTHGISSDDPEAVSKLQKKLEEMQKSQAEMKSANSAARHIGLPQPFASYQLANNNGNMARVKERIVQLTKKEEMPTRDDVTGNGFVMKEDKEENRIMFIFRGKPSDEARTIMKYHAFKWSPLRGAWVRLLNNNGRFAADQIIKKLNALTA